MLSDLWSPIEEIRAILTQLSSNGAQGHLVQIVDPAEETFPYSGRIEFIEPEGAGEITAGRAENWRADYERAARAPSRRNPRRDRPARLELHHPPHRPPGERAAAGAACPHRRGQRRGRHQPPAARHGSSGGPHDGPAARLRLSRWCCSGLLSLPVLWWLLRLIPPRPRRIEFPPTRLLFDIEPKEDTPARTPWWLTLLRLTLAALVILAAAGPLWNPPVATTTGSDADRAADRRRLGRGGKLGRAAAHRRRHHRPRRGRQPRRRARPARRSQPRHLAAAAGRRARAAEAAQAEAARGRAHRGAAGDLAAARRHAPTWR